MTSREENRADGRHFENLCRETRSEQEDCHSVRWTGSVAKRSPREESKFLKVLIKTQISFKLSLKATYCTRNAITRGHRQISEHGNSRN